MTYATWREIIRLLDDQTILFVDAKHGASITCSIAEDTMSVKLSGFDHDGEPCEACFHKEDNKLIVINDSGNLELVPEGNGPTWTIKASKIRAQATATTSTTVQA